MATQEDARLELDSSAPDIVVVTALPAGHAAVAPAGSSTAAGPGPRTGRTALVVALLVVLVVTVAGAVLRSGRHDVVAEPAQGPTLAPSVPAPAPLTLSVTLPATVVAGQPAGITVRYADGDGRFGGSTEEWGDGVGSASAKQGPCAAGAGFGPLEGSYTATHTWTRPGTYTVAIGVRSYTCTGTAAVAEQASRSVAVRVTAP